MNQVRWGRVHSMIRVSSVALHNINESTSHKIIQIYIVQITNLALFESCLTFIPNRGH